MTGMTPDDRPFRDRIVSDPVRIGAASTTGYGPNADALRAEVDADNAKDREIKRLQVQLANTQGHRERLVREAATMTRELNRLTAELATCRERNAAIAVQSDKYRDERDDARDQLDEIRAMVDATRPHFSAEQLGIVLRAIHEAAGLEPQS